MKWTCIIIFAVGCMFGLAARGTKDQQQKRIYWTIAALLWITILILVNLPSPAHAWSGKCVSVTDGDTIKVMRQGKAERIRLYGIDCPEKKQPFGTKAKQFASDLVYKKIVEIKPIERDRYGRTIAWVYVGGKCLNKELLKAGLAWHYKQYSKDRDLAELETEARQKKIGLWSDPIPPWKFRKLKK